MTTTAVSTIKTLTNAGVGPVEVMVEERGAGQPFLVLHGGAGPQSVAGFAQLLAEEGNCLVITPTHPGFGGTSRPDELNTVAKLAALYVNLLDDLRLEDVTVIGNSVGGWIAAEMALLENTAHQALGAPRCGRYRSGGPPCGRRRRSIRARDPSTIVPRLSALPCRSRHHS